MANDTAPAGFAHVYSGKVRDLYAPLDSEGQPRTDQMLLVASDRISAFDYVLDSVIPDKGEVLTRLSLWWFAQMADLVPNHVVSAATPHVPAEFAGRAVLVERLEMLPVEAVARAYLTGGGLSEYQQSGAVSGVSLPAGLQESSRLESPIFTPSSKAELGEHDEPISFAQVEELIGADAAAEIRDLTVKILARGTEIARERGIIIADTKVEFGYRPGSKEIVLGDEVLTPDSSRFWPADNYVPGQVQDSFDKQFVRDWLLSPESGWSRSPGIAPPVLPEKVIAATRARYIEAYEKLTGEKF